MDYLGRLNHSRCKNRALPSLRRLAVFVAGLLVLSIAAAPALAQRKKVERVAVLTFKSIGTTKEMGEAVAEILRTELVDVGGFELVERGQIQALLKEQKLQLQDVIDEQTAVKIGRLSGAKLVVIGSIVKL
ncbi:MAG: CsgG/HfaB family protein, partial [Nitrospinota bacterium]|nr:CsgG/HfaB family protein [Nitrospinota bacterium]